MNDLGTVQKGLSLLAAAATLCGCATGYGSQRGTARGFLRLEVEPPGAVVEIDEQYSGIANGWVDGVVPVKPGIRRLTLRADGYIAQRFDIEVAPYEEVTLILKLEPELDLPEEAPEQREPRPFRPSLRAVR